ncbi:MAG TPA: hypothetical protein DCY74_07230 [Clostridiales bacterium]|jgi:hypothetical protein|nr:hypothetical protein [Clostridiales bacterium]HBE13946.1 hypothetical protein [Clostridiales bacterium]HCG36313.1 hypothetical protein [Clostridiales bacterium]
MIILYSVLGIFLLVFLALMTHIHLTVSYTDTLKLELRVLFVRVDMTERMLASKGKKEKERHDVPKQQTEKDKISDVLEYIEVMKRTVYETFQAVKKHVKIKVKTFHLCVACPDAAETALVWGGLKPAVDILFDILRQTMPFQEQDTVVYPDFTGKSFSFTAQISFSARLIHVIKIIFTVINQFTG